MLIDRTAAVRLQAHKHGMYDNRVLRVLTSHTYSDM
jgi:hypothetical protein